jgi:putative copper resistance protein D
MTDLPVIGIRFALYADLMLLTGLAAFPLYALGRDERGIPGLLSILAGPQRWLCTFGLAVSALGMAVLTASMQGVGPLSVDAAMLLTMIRETEVGTAWLYRMIALLIAAGAAWGLAVRPVTAAAVLAAAGSLALATLAWSGHAGATEGSAGTIHRISDVLHMIAAAIWLGAITAFLLLLRPRHGAVPPERAALAARTLDRFALVGTLCVLVLTATGLVNAQLIVGIENAARSAASPYARLLLAKLLLFGAMLVLAAMNRWRLTPALAASLVDGNTPVAVGAIRRSLVIEIFAGAAILALVAWFGTLEPLPAFDAV